jgi:hypothetical protein
VQNALALALQLQFTNVGHLMVQSLIYQHKSEGIRNDYVFKSSVEIIYQGHWSVLFLSLSHAESYRYRMGQIRSIRKPVNIL